MSRLGNIATLGHRLHRGEIAYDFVGKRWLWYGVSLVITLAAIVGLAVNGLHYGIEFSGGAVFTTPQTSISVADAQQKIAGDTGARQATVQKLGTGGLRIQISDISTDQSKQVQQSISQDLGMKASDVDAQIVGPSWGEEISKKAFTGLIIFMVLVVGYLALAFEWRKAVAALVALIHDLTITVGVYAIVGFEVTPGTVIGLLTILGYSLYDTVVVFDGLKETTKNITKQNRFTYSELANRSLNQTLVRSINTTVVALLPVGALLFIGGGLLGAGMLNDIALALFVGLTAGAYSSIFIATPIVTDLKEREPAMKALRKRVLARRAAEAANAADGPVDEHGTTGDDESEDATAVAGIGGPRPQSTVRNRGRNRPSGKRR